MQVGDKYKVKIIDEDNIGNGIARIDNLVIFIKNALINEELEVEITNINKKYLNGRIINIIKSSSERKEPLCKYYEECGGCNFLHTSFDNEINIKTKYLNKLFNREINYIKVNNEYNYRNKVVLHVLEGKIGLYNDKTHSLCNLDSCMLLNQKINSKKLGNTIFTNIKNIGDPFIFYENKNYYMFGTSLNGESLSCYIGNNLTKFNEKPAVVLNKKDSFGNSDFWAPEIIKYNGQYYMFYSSRGDDKDLHVSVAKSNNVIGPYIDINKEKPLLPWVTIDASPFIDADGKAYLLFVMDCSKNIVDGKHTSEINIIRLDKSLSKTIGKPKKLLTPDSKWEYKKSDEFRWNDGPSMIYHDGYYYITYSAHSYLDPDYSVGVARSKKVTGPFIKSKDSPILKRIEKITSGTGHNSFFIDKNGQLMTAYHIHTDIDNPALGRRACISPVKFVNNSLIIDYK